ncbi:MAG: cytochrome c3 family protein [Nitrospirota bacterium]
MLLLTVVLVLVAGIASAGIVDSKHDMRTWLTGATLTTQVCVFCHTPHQPEGRTTDPLWNHSLSTVASYGVYSSLTMNAVPTALVNPGETTSHLCLSCHDGTVAVNSLWKQPKDGDTGSGITGSALNASYMITSGAMLGTSLDNDHPVNFLYSDSVNNGDGGLFSETTVSNMLIGGYVQCASCHQVHDNTNAPFLRVTNVGSALCITCHNK